MPAQVGKGGGGGEGCGTPARRRRGGAKGGGAAAENGPRPEGGGKSCPRRKCDCRLDRSATREALGGILAQVSISDLMGAESRPRSCPCVLDRKKDRSQASKREFLAAIAALSYRTKLLCSKIASMQDRAWCECSSAQCLPEGNNGGLASHKSHHLVLRHDPMMPLFSQMSLLQ